MNRYKKALDEMKKTRSNRNMNREMWNHKRYFNENDILANAPYIKGYSELKLSEYLFSLKDTPQLTELIEHFIKYNDDNYPSCNLFSALDSYLHQYYRATIFRLSCIDRPGRYRTGDFGVFTSKFYQDISNSCKAGIHYQTDPIRNYVEGYKLVIKELLYDLSMVYSLQIKGKKDDEWQNELNAINRSNKIEDL